MGKSNWEGDAYLKGCINELVIFENNLGSTELNCLLDQCNNFKCSKCTGTDVVCAECAANRINLPTCDCPVHTFDNGTSEC